MKSMVQPDKRLAEAVAVLVEAIHHAFPMASTRSSYILSGGGL